MISAAMVAKLSVKLLNYAYIFLTALMTIAVVGTGFENLDRIGYIGVSIVGILLLLLGLYFFYVGFVRLFKGRMDPKRPFVTSAIILISGCFLDGWLGGAPAFSFVFGILSLFGWGLSRLKTKYLDSEVLAGDGSSNERGIVEKVGAFEELLGEDAATKPRAETDGAVNMRLEKLEQPAGAVVAGPQFPDMGAAVSSWITAGISTRQLVDVWSSQREKSMESPIAKEELTEKPIETYSVIYLGGWKEHPKGKAGGIIFQVFQDRFELVSTFSTRRWFSSETIRFDRVEGVQIEQRLVSTFEAILGGLDSRQLNQANNIHITYTRGDGSSIVLRLEMISGGTVMGQASKCRELMDRLKSYGLLEGQKKPQVGALPAVGGDDIPYQIERLAGLLEKGFLTQAEFDRKKSELLARM